MKTLIRKFTTTTKNPTCREGELYLLIDNFHGDEVMFLIEAAVVQQQTIWLSSGKSEKDTTTVENQQGSDFTHASTANVVNNEHRAKIEGWSHRCPDTVKEN